MTIYLHPVTPQQVCPHCGAPIILKQKRPNAIRGKKFQVVEQSRIPSRWMYQYFDSGDIITVRTLPIPLLFVEEKS